MSFKELATWSTSKFSYLPWRDKRNLYNTLVSEIMLQQTTVPHAIKHFSGLIQKYPNISSLSKASEEEILLHWRGLGYYRRAKNLLKGACYIQKDLGGRLPHSYKELIKIPGVGPYTANAILSIGRDLPILAIDSNLERVLSRFYGIKSEKGIVLQNKIQELFQERKILISLRSSGGRILNESLMDLGRTYCKSHSVNCDECPLRKNCLARKEGNVFDYPKSSSEKKSGKYLELKLLRLIVNKSGSKKIMVIKKEKNEWLADQWELPTLTISSEDPRLKQYPRFPGHFLVEGQEAPSFNSSITKYKITNYIKCISEKEFLDSYENLSERTYQYIDIKSVDKVGVASSVIKTLRKMKLYK